MANSGGLRIGIVCGEVRQQRCPRRRLCIAHGQKMRTEQGIPGVVAQRRAIGAEDLPPRRADQRIARRHVPFAAR